MFLKSALVALSAAATFGLPAMVSAHPAGYVDYDVAPYQQNNYGAYSNGYAYGAYGRPQGHSHSRYDDRWAPQAYAGSSRGWDGYSRYGSRHSHGYGGYGDERGYRGQGHHHHHQEEDHHDHYDRD